MGDRMVEVAGRDLVRGAATAAGEVSAPSLRLLAVGSRNSPMSTTLAWVCGVWYESPAKFSAPIFQLHAMRHRCGPRSSTPASL